VGGESFSIDKGLGVFEAFGHNVFNKTVVVVLLTLSFREALLLTSRNDLPVSGLKIFGSLLIALEGDFSSLLS